MTKEKKKCLIDSCDRNAIVKGMCDKHYRQMKKHGRITDDERSPLFVNRIGEENYDCLGIKMIIVEYKSARSVVVEFQDEHKARVLTQYNNFKNGSVKNPYHKSVFNIGYLGQGEYTPKEYPKIYDTWYDMIRRCYNPYSINKNRGLAYQDVFVCEEWHCFQNFAKWYEENYYEVNNEKMCLDKDILIKGNKIYSPNNCIFTPIKINCLFTKRKKNRGQYPIGVSCHKEKKVLEVHCDIGINNEDKVMYLGHFSLNRPFQAFYCYKQFKEKYIKQIADEYKDLIPKKLYEALYKYEVEIND